MRAHALQGTRVEGIIAKLFQGRTLSFIDCINVDYKSSHKDEFEDLQVGGGPRRRRPKSACGLVWAEENECCAWACYEAIHSTSDGPSAPSSCFKAGRQRLQVHL